MSFQYDQYLDQHKANVKRGFDWISENLPELLKGGFDYGWQICFAHDQSKSETDEYEAYDAYFYGGNRSYSVVRAYERAWLLHLHRNPHHWQHWILINDDPKEGEIILEMPYNYVIEMICDWWAFSWAKGNLAEIFSWYNEHKDYMKLHPKTRKIVDDILEKICAKLEIMPTDGAMFQHHGVKGMKWGVRNGPPYPLKSATLKNAAGKGIISVEHVDLKGPPGGIIQVTRKNGGVDRNYYDETGRQTTQISNHNHGQPGKHPYGERGEHAHDYIYDEAGNLEARPARNLTEKERKENGDFL